MINIGTAEIIKSDSRHLPIPDNSVDLIITSPPYFALRSYQDGGQHYAGQIGDEPTPAAFVDSLLDVTRECVRVLKPSGSLWVNLGDKYSTGSSGQRMNKGRDVGASGGRVHNVASVALAGMAPKSLIGIPWRYALRCIDDLGLILRAEVIWSKPNGLPESVTDRVRRSHEQWFHFTLQPRYFSAVDEIREQHAPDTAKRYAAGYNVPKRADGEIGLSDRGIYDGTAKTPNPLGKLPGSVWDIPTQPLKVPAELGVDHFAAFPMEWPRRIIRGWSPNGICTACGEGRRPVTDTTPAAITPSPRRAAALAAGAGSGRTTPSGTQVSAASHQITGYCCACPDDTAPTRPAVILDPFGGTGTTALVAKALGCHGISVDMSSDYCRLAEWRTNDRQQIAQVLGVTTTDDPGLPSLFDDIEDGAA